MSKDEVIDILVERNGFEYNLSKASEEFQELALVLTQKLNKPSKVKDVEITDEIGDAIIRLEILKKMYEKTNPGIIFKRVDYKLSKFADYIDHKKYTKI